MGTTRRGFLGRVLAVLAAPSAAIAAAKEVVEPGHFGLSAISTPEHLENERIRNALLKAQLDEAYLRTNPMIQVDGGVVRATDLSRMGPGEILHIDPHETPFMSMVNSKSEHTIHEWTEDPLFTSRIALDKYK